MQPRTPRDACARCSEYLPQYCAAVVTVRRGRFGRKTVTITDRQPAAYQAGRWGNPGSGGGGGDWA